MLPGPEESATGEEQYEQNDDDDPEHGLNLRLSVLRRLLSKWLSNYMIVTL